MSECDSLGLSLGLRPFNSEVCIFFLPKVPKAVELTAGRSFSKQVTAFSFDVFLNHVVEYPSVRLKFDRKIWR
jgi:hypothetical protein